MKRLKEILIPITFILILVLPTVDSIFHFIPDVKNTENREFKKQPKFLLPLHDTFPNSYNEYYSDNFDLRNQFLWFNSKLRYYMFNIPPISGKAIMGRSGWMYLVKHEMDIYWGNNLANQEELNRYYEIFKYRKKVLDSIKCKYYIVIAPIKTSIYPEYLPLSKRKNVETTITDQIVSLLDTVNGITVIDLRTALKSAKGNVRMFHKTDNHWNDYGGFVAYEAIMNTLSVDFPELTKSSISDYIIDSTVVDGFKLTNMMGIYDGIFENKITCKLAATRKSKKVEKRKYPGFPNFSLNSKYELRFKTENDSLPKILMIRDSFGSTLIPYLNEHFSESVYIFDMWNYCLNEDILFNEKPDIFIQTVVEPFISNIKYNAKNP